MASVWSIACGELQQHPRAEGVSETGTIGALPTLMNTVVNALSQTGVEEAKRAWHLPLPQWVPASVADSEALHVEIF